MLKYPGKRDFQSIMSDKIQGFEPVFDSQSRVLILGSFPSVKSRQTEFYYGNPQNRFWRMLGSFFGEHPAGIGEKRSMLLRRGVALWDAVVCCEITGSSDASIRNFEAADVPSLLARTRISRILCNGKTAYRILTDTYPDLPVPVLSLPSTSPANPRYRECVWHAALAEAFGRQGG